MPLRDAYRRSSAGSWPTSSRCPRSAPEQNVPPAPWMTAAPTAGSRSTTSQATTNCSAISWLSAFLVLGAFSVMYATPSVIFRSIMGSVSRGGLEQAGGQGLAAVAEFGRLDRGEGHVEQDQVQGDRVEGIRTRGEHAPPVVHGLDDRDGGWHHARDDVDGGIQQDTDPPAIGPGRNRLADE